MAMDMTCGECAESGQAGEDQKGGEGGEGLEESTLSCAGDQADAAELRGEDIVIPDRPDRGLVMEFDMTSGDGCRKKPLRKPQRQLELEGFRRFTVPQKSVFERALGEIRAGKKDSCWMWFVIPTPPFIVDGVEKGSARNRKFALRSDDEAREYLEFESDGVSLRENYMAIMIAIREQLASGRKAVALMGVLDEPKLRSSAKFFERVLRSSQTPCDIGLHAILREVLQLLQEESEDGAGNMDGFAETKMGCLVDASTQAETHV